MWEYDDREATRGGHRAADAERRSTAVLEALLSKLQSPRGLVVRNFDRRDAALEGFADRLDRLGPDLTPDQAAYLRSCCLVVQERALLPAISGQGHTRHPDVILDAVTTMGFPDRASE